MDSKKVVLVTGGLGYIGSHTVVELYDSGYDVEIIDNLANSSIKCLQRLEKMIGKSIKFHQIDLLEYDKVEKVFKDAEKPFYAIIHFAGLKSVQESMSVPLKYYHVNIISSINVMELASKYGCGRFIFSSSACVYGEGEEPCREDGVLNPINPYGRTKLMIEQMLTDHSRASNGTFKAILLRYFNPVGAHKSGNIGESPNNVARQLFAVVEKHIKGQLDKIQIFGKDYNTPDGTGIRDYIHIIDLAQAHVVALNKFEDPKLTNSDVYNIGTNSGISVLEILTEYEKILGKKLNYEFVARREGDSARCVANAEKAMKELGWKAKYGVKEMCEDSLRWITLNPNGYE